MQRLQQAKNNQPRGLNENYARELMELHTLGVDGGYTQKDVQEVARVLTGWTIDQPRQGGAFVFRPQMHDFGEKTVLGQAFPAKHGQDEGERVLDILASHPSTAHHIAFQLSQRFVADEPPASLVDRAADVFLKTHGDLREVTRTIITSPEFFAADAYRAKVKTPFEFIVSAVRMSGATINNAQPIIGELRQNMGMPLYGCQPPTGYSSTAERVGEHRRAARPHELRAAARHQHRARRRRADVAVRADRHPRRTARGQADRAGAVPASVLAPVVR